MSVLRTIVTAALFAAAPLQASEYRAGGKLLLTDGVTSVEGAAGGGLASWAVIGGRATKDGVGAGFNATAVHTGRFKLQSLGAKVGLYNRLELSIARQRFDTRSAGAELGLGRGFTLGQDVFGAKLRLFGDVIYDSPYLPQVSIGVQHKVARKGWLLRALGATRTRDTEFYASATKVILSQGLVLDATARLTRANQFGLLGFGGDRQGSRSVQFEGSAGKLITKRLLVGAEYRTKPSNLGFAEEQNAVDLFAAYAINRNVNLTAAYLDLGSIATFKKQRGLFFSLQGAF